MEVTRAVFAEGTEIGLDNTSRSFVHLETGTLDVNYYHVLRPTKPLRVLYMTVPI